jgi:hypothetical protein
MVIVQIYISLQDGSVCFHRIWNWNGGHYGILVNIKIAEK